MIYIGPKLVLGKLCDSRSFYGLVYVFLLIIYGCGSSVSTIFMDYFSKFVNNIFMKFLINVYTNFVYFYIFQVRSFNFYISSRFTFKICTFCISDFYF